jgi:hypothetical protein
MKRGVHSKNCARTTEWSSPFQFTLTLRIAVNTLVDLSDESTLLKNSVPFHDNSIHLFYRWFQSTVMCVTLRGVLSNCSQQNWLCNCRRYVPVSGLKRSLEGTYYTVSGHCSCRPAYIELSCPGVFNWLSSVLSVVGDHKNEKTFK